MRKIFGLALIMLSLMQFTACYDDYFTIVFQNETADTIYVSSSYNGGVPTASWHLIEIPPHGKDVNKLVSIDNMDMSGGWKICIDKKETFRSKFPQEMVIPDPYEQVYDTILTYSYQDLEKIGFFISFSGWDK